MQVIMQPVAVSTSSEKSPKGRLWDFRLIPRVESNPAVVRFAQTAAGKTVLLTAFALGMRLFTGSFLVAFLYAAVFALITFEPGLRWPVLTAGPVVWVLLRSEEHT